MKAKTRKSNLKKVFGVSMSVLMMSTTLPLAACQPEGEKVDPNKTQFHIGNFDGGYGHTWLEQAVEKFEKKYENESFESGKTGVQIWINNAKDEYNSYEFFTTISGLEQDFFVAPQPRDEIINGELLIPINDLLDESMAEFGENKTIRQKLADWYKEAYLISDVANDQNEETIYYLPTAEAYFGDIVYDVDLFEKEGYFIKEGGGWTSGVANDKSVGMDGVKGTYDDGLPTNEDEFFALLDEIEGAIPFTWAGQYPAYMNAFVFNLFCNYDDGVGQKLYNTLDGEYVIDGETVTFNGYNFTDTQRLPGRLAALEVVEKLIDNTSYYSGKAFNKTQSHIQAQDEFLLSAKQGTPIAMLIEGTWWESEASETFNSMAQTDAKYGKNERRLGLMPVIRPDGSTGTKTNFITSAQALFINGNTEHVELAKKFMMYLLSDEIRELFTNVTGCPSPYDYQLSNTTYENLSHFGKNLWEIHTNKDGKFNFVTENRTSAAYKKNAAQYPYNFQAQVGDDLTSCPFTYFKFTSGATSMKYFQGMQDLAKKRYDDYFAKYVED
jgi:ABC-type glycerol-3-phosphate transport system substrate-binding protein